jgi:hypothetical protein
MSIKLIENQLINPTGKPRYIWLSLLPLYKPLLKNKPMKFIGVLMICAFSFGVNAQEKQIDMNAQTAKLSTVQSEIVVLEEKIGRIEGRLEETDPQNITPATQEELDRLKMKLDHLKRVEVSVKAYIDSEKKEPKKSSDK